MTRAGGRDCAAERQLRLGRESLRVPNKISQESIGRRGHCRPANYKYICCHLSHWSRGVAHRLHGGPRRPCAPGPLHHDLVAPRVVARSCGACPCTQSRLPQGGRRVERTWQNGGRWRCCSARRVLLGVGKTWNSRRTRERTSANLEVHVTLKCMCLNM